MFSVITLLFVVQQDESRHPRSEILFSLPHGISLLKGFGTAIPAHKGTAGIRTVGSNLLPPGTVAILALAVAAGHQSLLRVLEL